MKEKHEFVNGQQKKKEKKTKKLKEEKGKNKLKKEEKKQKKAEEKIYGIRKETERLKTSRIRERTSQVYPRGSIFPRVNTKQQNFLIEAGKK